jgi:aldehyde:ferredoxin oxidoreductase
LLERLGLSDLPDAATPVGSAAEVPDLDGDR